MPSKADREERRLQRQRGAAKREVKNTADFDIVLPSQDTAQLELQRAGRLSKTPQPQPQPLKPRNRTPAPIIKAKRKRPSGEDIFDFPESPEPLRDIGTSLKSVDEQSSKKPRADEEVDGDIDERHAEDGGEQAGVSDSMEANGTVNQRIPVKKRKKRKSIGQQAPRRAKARVSLIQKPLATEVKPEPMSSPLPHEGSSRLEAFPAGNEDPSQAQIRQELAGMAEKGVHDSFADGTQANPSETRPKSKRKSITHQNNRNRNQSGDNFLGESDLRTDPHIYSLPDSTSAVGFEEPYQDEEEQQWADGEEEEEAEDDAEQGEAMEESEPRAPTAEIVTTKTKRKKRKSIGQQKPKRASPLRPSRHPNPNPKQKHINKPTTAPSNPRPRKPNPNPTTKIPITIYRPDSPSPPSSASSIDPLTAPLPPPPKTLTAIDILSQITRELISKTASNPALSTRSQATISLYGQELEARMLQLGRAGATNRALVERVGKVVKGEERRVKGEVKGVVEERVGVREKIEGLRRVERGVRLRGLLEGVAGVVAKGWRWGREREREREKASERDVMT